MYNHNSHEYEFELRRKAFHCLSLVAPIVYHYIPCNIGKSILCALTVTVVISDILRYRYNSVRHYLHIIFGSIMRRKEKNSLFSGLTYAMFGLSITSLLFPKEICIVAWLVLVFSDAIAAIVGLVANPVRRKNIYSFITFIISAMIVMTLYFKYIEYVYDIKILAISAIVTAIAEFYSYKLMLNDNLTIPIVCAIAIEYTPDLLKFIM